jgi:hypothetical protein
MANEVISYLEMCSREGTSLQRGMNFGLGSNHSVVLMSVRPNAPYRDRLEDEGTTLIYEGHVCRWSYSQATPNSLAINQITMAGTIASGTVNPSPAAPKLSKSPKTCIL